MRKYYLVTTDHLEDALWFRDDDDFATGMNYVAIQAALTPEVMVLVFILMSNHVHFVLYGTRREVEAFVNDFKGRYSKYLNKKYGAKEFLRRNSLDIKELPMEETEALERGMAYVQMNCVAANICLYPGQYLWGTGNVFFQADTTSGGVHKYRRVGDLSGRERVRLLHSGQALALPADWLLADAGYVLPESEEENLPAFRDQVILSAIPDLLQSLFQKKTFDGLTNPEKTEALRQIRFRFSAGVHQAARVCGLTYADAASLLDAY